MRYLSLLLLATICHAQVNVTPSATFTTATSISGGIEPTPTMGWNPWQIYGAGATETQIRNNCAAMASNGMLAAGYNYCGWDDVWSTTRVSGVITPTASYPTISTLCSYIHGLGEKCAGYLAPGPTGCNSQTSSQGYEYQDVALLASWGVDYIKGDTCYNSWSGPDAINQYGAFGQAMKLSGRPIRFYLSIGPVNCSPGASPACPYTYTWFQGIGSEAASGNDIVLMGCGTGVWNMTFTNLTTFVDSQNGLASFGGPNHYLLPGVYLGVGNGCLTDTEGISDFSLTAILAAPMITSIDLTAPPSSNTMTTLLNSEVIAVDQDPLGIIGTAVSSVSCGSALCNVYAKQLMGGAWAIVLWNRDTASHSITVNWSMFGQTGPYTNTRDLWAHTSLGTLATGYTTTVVAHGVSMIRVAP